MILPLEDFVGNSHGEEVVWSKFQEMLPQSFVSFHNYDLGLKQVDVMVLVPDRGVLIIEIKDYRARNIIDVPDRTVIRIKNQPPIPSPYTQALKYKNILVSDVLAPAGIDSVYVVPAVCYPYISKDEFTAKKLSKISHERLTITSEDLASSEQLLQKFDDIFDMAYDAIAIPTLAPYGFHLDLLNQVGNLISEDFRNESVDTETVQPDSTQPNTIHTVSPRTMYSKFIYHLKSDSLSNEAQQEIIADWRSGVKIYFYSDDTAIVDSIIAGIQAEIDALGLSDRKDFKFIGKNTFLFNADYAPTLGASISMVDGIGINDYLLELTQLHAESTFNKDQYLLEHAPLEDIIVKAGAGTGKTYSIVSRINFLIWTNKYQPEDLKRAISMITFTNESADAMKDKLEQNFINYFLLTKVSDYLSFVERVEDMNISTIHAMAKKILQKYAAYIGLGKDFSIVTGNYKRGQLLQQHIDSFVDRHPRIEQEIDLSMFHLSQRLTHFLERLDNKNVDIVADRGRLNFGAANAPIFNQLIDVICDTQRDMSEYCGKNNSVSLGDLIRKLKTLQRSMGELELAPSDKVDYLFVDEFQDTDDVQIELMTTFKQIFGFKFFVVGDIKQCIYRFRGAEVKAFDTLVSNNGSPMLHISLNKNYRTDICLLTHLNGIFERWHTARDLDYSGDDVLKGTKHYLDVPFFHEIPCINDQAFERKLVKSLETLKAKLESDKDKIAILVRYNWQIAQIREICESNKIPIETEIGGELFKIDPTIDLFKLIQALKFNTSPKHLYNLYTTSYVREQMPKIEIWNTPQDKIVELFHQNLPDRLSKWPEYTQRLRTEPVLKVLRDVIDDVKPWEIFSEKTGAVDEDIARCESYYIRNLDQLFERLIAASNTDYLTINKLADYLEIMILTRKEEEARASYDIENSTAKIICTTVHKSKGLEFDTVLLPYCGFDISCAKAKGDVDLIYSGHDVGYRILGAGQNVMFENDLYQTYQKNEVIDRKHEEARILYVALTRAIKRIVYFSDTTPGKRKHANSWETLIKET